MRLLVAIVIAAIPLAAADYPVAGVVINAQTGSPLPRAEVYLFLFGAAKPVANMTTREDGRFHFNVPEGSYVMVAGTRVQHHKYGEKHPDEGYGSAVIVGPTHNTTQLMFRWYPLAAITGKVVDDAGEPIENAFVQLLRSSVMAGRRVTLTVSFARTNDLGEYRFGSMPGGARYYVEASAKPWYSPNNQFVQTAGPSAAFVPLYYPNTPDPARAAPLTPRPGEEARADFALTPAVGATITVKHNLPAGKQAVVNLLSAGIAGNETFQDPQMVPQLLRQNGAETRFTDVPPGHYTVRVTTGTSGNDLEGSAAVDVNGADVTVEVAMHPSATLSGLVIFKNPNTKPPGSMVIGLATEEGVSPFNALVRPDGRFVFPAVLGGKYRPVLRAAGIVTSAIEVTGAPFHNGFVELSPGDSASMKVTASDETGGVSGFAMNGDQPADAVLAVLAPATLSDDWTAYRGYQTESDGSFDFRNIPAGKYLLFAVEDTALEYANPAVVRPYLAAAKPVTIEAHGSSTERIPVTSPIQQ